MLSILFFFFILSSPIYSLLESIDNGNFSISLWSKNVSGQLFDSGVSQLSLSSDGDYIAFSSISDNIVSTTSNFSNIFWFDSVSNTFSLVSGGLNNQNINADCLGPSISYSGNYIAFSCEASNLVLNDTNGVSDVFLWSSVGSSITRISASVSGVQGNGDSFEPVISSSGRYVAFTSVANNLVPNDTNNESDIFLKDTVLNRMSRVSVTTSGSQQNGACFSPDMNLDGNTIAFVCNSNLMPGMRSDLSGINQIWAYYTITSSVVLISSNITGHPGNAPSRKPKVSGYGGVFVFESDATNLVDMTVSPGRSRVYLRDISAPLISLLSENYVEARAPSISDSGRFVSFSAKKNASDSFQIYVFDFEQDTVWMVSRSNTSIGNLDSISPIVSGNGSRMGFLSMSTNLINLGISNSKYQIMIADSTCSSTCPENVGYCARDGSHQCICYNSSMVTSGLCVNPGGTASSFVFVSSSVGYNCSFWGDCEEESSEYVYWDQTGGIILLITFMILGCFMLIGVVFCLVLSLLVGTGLVTASSFSTIKVLERVEKNAVYKRARGSGEF